MIIKMLQRAMAFLVVIGMVMQSIMCEKQSTPITIRLATKDDIPACVRITRQVYTTIYKPLESVYSDEQWQEWLDELNDPSDVFFLYTSQLLVAETADKKIVGCVMVAPFSLPDVSEFMRNTLPLNFDLLAQRFHGSAAYVFRLYVNENYRGSGIGKKLLQASVEFFGPVEKMYLDTLVLNTNAMSFYKYLGFVEEYERRVSAGDGQVVVLSINTNQLQ
ncbi:MAG TPA: GNAT family N-acetyltransferase [Candidatus Babeliales bacterium]|nr:GNAT family N-acetyltransferase [Candidatus Babeliales bacterium]